MKSNEMRFSDAEHLRSWLMSKDIDISSWGHDEFKSVNNLWHEIVNEDSVITDDPVMRTVNIVQVFISRGNRTLFEVEQTLHDGRTRARRIPPTEKFSKSESCSSAAMRCINEELGIPPSNVELNMKSFSFSKKIITSPSYPNLRTTYCLFKIKAKVLGLPGSDFITSNSFASAESPIIEHRWSWQRVNSR